MKRQQESAQRLQVTVFVTRYPEGSDTSFHVEVVARKNLDSFDGGLKASLSPTKFVYWLTDLLESQVGALARIGAYELWDDVLSQLPLDAAEAPELAIRAREVRK